MGRKKKSPLTPVMDCSTIREKVCSYLLTVYESKDEPTMKRTIENMSSLYIEVMS
jgi:hypothetical protein